MVSVVHTLRQHADELSGCAFSAALLATCSADKTLRVYSTADFSELPFSPLSGHGYGVHCCRFSSCGRHLLSCSTDGSVVVWSSDTGEAAAVLQHPGRSPLRVCALAPDSSLLLAGASDGTLALWDFPCKTLRRCSAVSEASVVACCFSPCGQFFVTGCTNGDLKLWDVDFSLLLAERDAHDLGVACCSSAPHLGLDGCCVEFRLASCGQDSQLKIWIVSQREGAGRKLPGHFRPLVADWSEEDVQTWLHEEGLEELVGIFKANNIDGPELSQLDKETAAELGIESVGLRGRLLRKTEALKSEQSDSEVPDEFMCPITTELMKDPVIAADGYSYERESIETWIRGKNKTSPMTNLALQTTLLTPNRSLKMAITRWKSSQ
ncbi:hypothetical protein F2P81_021218 [Scophthalmus maximus]|uniref:WD repeat, SAM and U-box domain-containing protein 1 n=1 Tax=Scophthalmus maximus TaxID=52904 RepID=A0A6A4S5S1_SCOMX|nr:hypothetical protein F2P81_021218 [Scophthalmus maximus]